MLAVSLANYGVEVSIVTRLPKNDIGESAVSILHKHNVAVDDIVCSGDWLGVYFHIILYFVCKPPKQKSLTFL